MAHFAELDDNNIVLRVIVIDTADTSTAQGVEKEYIGAAFCERLFGGTWKQTSYNAKIRKNYAGIGFSYDESKDAFIAPSPFLSWVLNEESFQWEPPTPYPNDEKSYKWDDVTQSWVEEGSSS